MRIAIRLSEHVDVRFTLIGKGQQPLVELPNACNAMFDANETSVFALCEEIRSQLTAEQGKPEGEQEETDGEQAAASAGLSPPSSTMSARVFRFASSELVTDRKSRFKSFAAWVETPADARAFVQFVVQSERRVGDATHRMLAWTCAGTSGRDDDGETGAGDRVLFLFDRLKLGGVCVLTVRWYGGVQLGHDRFRIISDCALQALTRLRDS